MLRRLLLVYALMMLLSLWLAPCISFAFITHHSSFKYGDEKFFSLSEEKHDLDFDPNFYRGTHASSDIIYLSQKNFSRLMLSQGLISKNSVLELERANLLAWKTLTDIAPKLNFTLSVDAPAIFLSGLLGVFVPSSWFKSGAAWANSKAMKYSMLSVLMSQFYESEIFYINLMRQQKDISIMRSYLTRIKSLCSYIRSSEARKADDHANDAIGQIMQQYALDFDNILTKEEGLYQQNLIELPLMLGIGSKLNPSFIDIDDFRGEENSKNLEQIILKSNMGKENDLVTYALERSFELKSMNNLMEELKWTKNQQSLDFVSAEEKIKLVIGPSLVTNTLVAQKNIEIVENKRDMLVNKIIRDVRRSLNDMENASKEFFIAKEAYENNKLYVEGMLLRYFGKDPNAVNVRIKGLDGIIYVLDLKIQSHLKMNRAMFSYMMANTRLAQLLQDKFRIIMSEAPREYVNLVSDLPEMKIDL